MGIEDLKDLKVGDKVKYFGRRYKIIRIGQGYYSLSLKSIGGHIADVKEYNLKHLEKGWSYLTLLQ